jgi:hypothetical protein
MADDKAVTALLREATGVEVSEQSETYVTSVELQHLRDGRNIAGRDEGDRLRVILPVMPVTRRSTLTVRAIGETKTHPPIRCDAHMDAFDGFGLRHGNLFVKTKIGFTILRLPPGASQDNKRC